MAVICTSPVVAAGLTTLLAELPGVDVVAVVDDGRWVRPPGTTDIGVALVDMTDHRSDRAAELLRSVVEDVAVGAVLVMAAVGSPSLMRTGRRLGIRSFASNTVSGAALLNAVLETAAGRSVDLLSAPRRSESWTGREDGLTERESQVLVLGAEGMTTREIAETLFISPETVRTHMKGAYARLGVRNRAQAASYVHHRRDDLSGPTEERRAAGLARATSSSRSRREPHEPPEPHEVTGGAAAFDEAALEASRGSLSEQLGISVGEITERMRLVGLDDSARQLLRGFGPAVYPHVEEFVERLVQRWLAHEPTAVVIGDSRGDVVVDRLMSYLRGLFGRDFDAQRVEEMLRIGAVHHRMQLAPQWFIASYAHFVTDLLPPIFESASTRAAALEATVALLSSMLVDAGLVLDSYEMCVEREILREVNRSAGEASQRPTRPSASAARPAPSLPSVIVKVDLSNDVAALRRSFLAFTDDDLRELAELEPVIRASVPGVLDAFYDLVTASDAVKAFVPGEVADRLRGSVAQYWNELAAAHFDAVHAASRMRIGVIHERIGLSPQLYLAGLARQVSGLLRSLDPGDERLIARISALVRAVLFDATFVLDAYMDARAKSLLQIGRFAGQVVAGLANGIAIVDARDRVEYANEQLLDLLGISAGVLHRLPIDRALPMDGIVTLVAKARSGPGGRESSVHDAWGRRLRITAIRLKQSAAGRAGLVALVLDDISDLVRTSEEHDHELRRFDHVLASLNAMVWELDATHLTVLAISSGALTLTGERDTDLLGRAELVELIDPEDRGRFLDACRSLEPGERGELDHAIRRRDGSVARVRTSLAATTSPDGSPTISGVTVHRHLPTSR